MAPLRPRCALVRLLVSLHFLLLSCMLLFELLRLLRVTLLHLLFLGLIGRPLSRLLMLFFLLLLQLLVFLVLFSSQLFLLLLIFLVNFRVAAGWGRVFVSLDFASVIVGRRASPVSFLASFVAGPGVGRPFRRLIGSASFACAYGCAPEFPRS